MTRYQPTAGDGEKTAEGNVISDEDNDLDYIEADEDEVTTQGQALISAILMYAPIEDVQKLLDDDAPLWYQDEDGWSALHAAASVEDVELVKRLLQHGALWNSGKARSHLPSRRAHEPLSRLQWTTVGTPPVTLRFPSTMRRAIAPSAMQASALVCFHLRHRFTLP
jgi:ankyrin repeat protein